VPGSSTSWLESFLDFVDDITEEPNPCLVGEDVPSNQASTLMVLARRPSQELLNIFIPISVCSSFVLHLVFEVMHRRVRYATNYFRYFFVKWFYLYVTMSM
jgi:hypothetical protein